MKITKEKLLISLIEKLDLPSRGWTIVDHWESDLCSIGFAAQDNPRQLVYVSIFNTEKGKYNYECEEPVGENPEDYITSSDGENVAYEDLVRILEIHLERK